MKNFILFKSYSTSKILPILYWAGFVAIFTGAPTLMHIYESAMYGSGDNGEWIKHESMNLQKQYAEGYIDQVYYNNQMEWLNKEREYYENSSSRYQGTYLPIILIIILQIFWRVFCEWWGRWFSFLNVPESSSADSNTENSTNKLKDFALIKAYIAVPYYAIVYLLLSIGCLIGLVYLYLNAPLTGKHFYEVTLYTIAFLMFLRLYFEMSIALFRYLKRR
jgi:hypothetical protein